MPPSRYNSAPRFSRNLNLCQSRFHIEVFYSTVGQTDRSSTSIETCTGVQISCKKMEFRYFYCILFSYYESRTGNKYLVQCEVCRISIERIQRDAGSGTSQVHRPPGEVPATALSLPTGPRGPPKRCGSLLLSRLLYSLFHGVRHVGRATQSDRERCRTY
jgi:hypothetical protein